MKISKSLATAIYSALFALVGCHPSPKPVFKVPPTLQAGYVQGGGSLQWAPTGEPFQIYWNGTNPCSKTDTLSSSGSSVVTCHFIHGGLYGGNYTYDVDKPDTHDKRAIHNGIYVMHVGSCSSCPAFNEESTPTGPTRPSNPQASSNSTETDDEVRVSCLAPGGSGTKTLVEPLAGPNGLKVTGEVSFEFVGQIPKPPLQPFTLTFKPNYCTALPSPYQIVGDSGFCQVSSAGTAAYTAQAADCDPNNDATLTAQ